MPKVLVFGTGSLGACYAWVLANAVGQDNVTAICRSNYDEVSRNGFTIHSGLWGDNLKFQPRVARSVTEAVEQQQQQQQQKQGNDDSASASQQPLFDFIIVACKALPTTPPTAELLRPAIANGHTAIALLQNGIGIEDEYATLYPGNPILSTVAYFPATQVAPGVVRHREIEALHVGTYPAASRAPASHADAAGRLVALLRRGGATATLHDDVQRERWGKLLVNAAWNPVCALTRLRDREFVDASAGLGLAEGEGEGERTDGVRFIKDVMMEIAAIAQAHGYDDVNEEMVDFQIGRAVRRDLPGVQPSMLADVFEGKALEADAIVGNAVRLARRKGLAVPMLRTIYLLANGLSESYSRTKLPN